MKANRDKPMTEIAVPGRAVERATDEGRKYVALAKEDTERAKRERLELGIEPSPKSRDGRNG